MRERVPPFQPDVYLVSISDRMVSKSEWASHLVTLIRTGEDLKYAYLRETVAPRALYQGAGKTYYNYRLSSERISTLRWSLDEIGKQADRDTALVVVVLVPS